MFNDHSHVCEHTHRCAIHKGNENAAHELLYDWDFDIDPARQTAPCAGASRREPQRLVYSIVLSMPPGTNAKRLFAAVQNFATGERGVEANATSRAIRGVTKPQKRDGEFRAMERGAIPGARLLVSASFSNL